MLINVHKRHYTAISSQVDKNRITLTFATIYAQIAALMYPQSVYRSRCMKTPDKFHCHDIFIKKQDFISSKMQVVFFLTKENQLGI